MLGLSSRISPRVRTMKLQLILTRRNRIVNTFEPNFAVLSFISQEKQHHSRREQGRRERDEKNRRKRYHNGAAPIFHRRREQLVGAGGNFALRMIRAFRF